MKTYPPYKVFLNFAIVFVCLVFLFFILPGEKYEVFNLIPGASGNGKSTLSHTPRPPEISGLIIHPADEPAPAMDSLLPLKIRDMPEFIHPSGIEYPNGDKSILLPFFKSLESIKIQNGLARILYYGDSQLEGDRITIFFRSVLQREYGGAGPGMISLAAPLYGSMSVDYSNSDNWLFLDHFTKGQGFPLSSLGTMLGYSGYKGESASLTVSVGDENSGSVSLFSSFRLFLYPGDTVGSIRYSSPGGDPGHWDVFPSDDFLHFQHTFPYPISGLNLQAENLEGAKFLGLSLETGSGVVVDNIARRGSAGLEFNRDKTGSFGKMAEFIEPDLIILQFGINVVPARTDNFDYYGNYMKTQIRFIQDQAPGVPILIVGVSDMGHLVDGVPKAYPSVEKVSSAQRTAATETGSAFFDLLDFMGGPGSFIRWTEANPPLMRRDFTHFSYAGGAIIGEGLAQALIDGFNEFLNQDPDYE